MKTFSSVCLMAIGIWFGMASCEKNDTDANEAPPVTPPAFYSLKQGNYWIYERSVYDSNDVLINTMGEDSVYVVGDTIIENKLFYVLRNSSLTGTSFDSFLRLEGNQTVDQNGVVKVAYSQLNDTIRRDTIDHIGTSYHVVKAERNFQVIAGTFHCINYRGTYHVFFPDGTLRYIDYTNQRFAPGLGLVMEDAFYVSNRSRIRKELIRYHLED